MALMSIQKALQHCRALYCRLSIVDCRLSIVDCRLSIVDVRCSMFGVWRRWKNEDCTNEDRRSILQDLACTSEMWKNCEDFR